MMFPVLVGFAWSAILHSKYGVFTTGTQFKTNLLQWTLNVHSESSSARYALLKDRTPYTDEYMVSDPMPPGSWPWTYKINARRAIPAILRSEARNLPAMLKELIILANPGLLLAFVILAALVIRPGPRSGSRMGHIEPQAGLVIIGAALSLLVAYSMLAVDSRYLLPLLPLLLAFGARFLVAGSPFDCPGLRMCCLLAVILGVAASVMYRSSPFRVRKQDEQVICYRAAAILKEEGGRKKTVVSIGSGPFPQHGVGWEAGYKTSYFADTRLVATDSVLPADSELPAVAADIVRAAPDAILIWGPDEARRDHLITALASSYVERARLPDPELGDMGAVLFSVHQTSK